MFETKFSTNDQKFNTEFSNDEQAFNSEFINDGVILGIDGASAYELAGENRILLLNFLDQEFVYYMCKSFLKK